MPKNCWKSGQFTIAVIIVCRFLHSVHCVVCNRFRISHFMYAACFFDFVPNFCHAVYPTVLRKTVASPHKLSLATKHCHKRRINAVRMHGIRSLDNFLPYSFSFVNCEMRHMIDVGGITLIKP